MLKFYKCSNHKIFILYVTNYIKKRGHYEQIVFQIFRVVNPNHFFIICSLSHVYSAQSQIVFNLTENVDY